MLNIQAQVLNQWLAGLNLGMKNGRDFATSGSKLCVGADAIWYVWGIDVVRYSKKQQMSVH